NSTYTETAEANSTLTFLGHNAIEAKPNSNHSVFKQNKNLAFLSKHPIIAGIKPNSKINTQNKVFNFSQGFSLSWANNQDPAYAHVTVDTLNGHYASTETFNSNLQYHFNGRWNKNLASQHNNIIHVNKINSQLVNDTSLTDEELRS